MISINPQPEPSLPIVRPREDETLQSWLARKIHITVFHDCKMRFGHWKREESC